jgi:hypothetical protein
MRIVRLAILSLLLGWACPAAALDPGRADGSLSVGSSSVELKAAYAVLYFNDEGLADGPELRILLVDRKVDVDLLAGPTAKGVERAARNGELRGILLRLDPSQLAEAPVRGTLLMQPATSADSLMHFTVTGGAGGFESLQVGKDRVQGRVQFRSAGGDSLAFGYRAAFSAPLRPDRPDARLIGQRAQDSPQGKTVLAFERALLDGDMATVSAHTTPERFRGLDADFARVGPVAFLEQVRLQLPEPGVRQRQIREVVIHGRRAWVLMVQEDGTRTIADLVHADGVWKID